MKTRIITGVSSALVAIAAIIFMQYPLVMGVLGAFFAGISVYEILHVIKCENKVIMGISVAFTAMIPLYNDIKAYVTYHTESTFFDNFKMPVWIVLAVYTFVILLVMLRMYEKTKFEHAAMAIFSSVAIGFSYSTLIFLRDLDHAYPEHLQQAQSFFIVLSSLYCAWISDTFAYFFGRKLGKHKLAPRISPKKSVEGAVAGVLGTIVVALITFFVASHWFDRYPDTIKWWMVALVTAAGVIMGMCGDLSASVIKRNYGEKDFGTLFPGHGGVMDRFDSFLFALPTVYIIITLVMSFVS